MPSGNRDFGWIFFEPLTFDGNDFGVVAEDADGVVRVSGAQSRDGR
jgi:hypothetical protein